MTLINLSVASRGLGIALHDVTAKVTIQAISGSKPAVTVFEDKVIFSELIKLEKASLTAGFAIELAPTDGHFCYSWKIETDFSQPFVRYTSVPSSTIPLNFDDLQQVDPKTFQPTIDVVTAWEEVLLEIANVLANITAKAEGVDQSVILIEGYRNDSISAKNAAVTAKDQSVAAKNASESAKTASESARDDSVAAKTAAQSAKSGAESALGSANAAANSAANAQGAAEDARNDSVSAKTASESARDQSVQAATDSNAAKTLSQSARDDSIAAKNASETARDQSVTAKNASETAKTDAVDAKNSAESARDSAITAKTGSESARDSAITAKNSAETAKTASETARDQSVTAKNDSVTAKTASETAKTASETARDQSVAAKNASETAKAGAEQAAQMGAFVYSAAANATGILDISSFNRNTIAHRTLTGNITGITLPTTPFIGQLITLVLTQDATGSRTIAIPASTLTSYGLDPTLSTAPSAIDVLHFWYDGVRWWCFVGSLGGA